MGLRRQEINGLKYSDVDYINRTLSVERQLGKELNRNLSYMDDVMPKKEKEQDLRECVLDADIKIEGYLPGKGKPE